MDNTILESVIKRLKQSDFQYKIESDLKERGLSEEEVASYLKAAQVQVDENKLATLPTERKLTFALLALTALLTLLAFLFILPGKGYTATTLISIVGAIAFTLAGLFAVVYFKSWTTENVQLELENEKKNSVAGRDISPILILAPIPIARDIYQCSKK